MGKQEAVKEKVVAYCEVRKKSNFWKAIVLVGIFCAFVVMTFATAKVFSESGTASPQTEQKCSKSAKNEMESLECAFGNIGEGIDNWANNAIRQGSCVVILIVMIVGTIVYIFKKNKQNEAVLKKLIEDLKELGCSRKEINGYLSELPWAEVDECLDQVFGKEKA